MQRFDQVITGGPHAGKTVIQSAQLQGGNMVFDAANLDAASGPRILGLFNAGNMSLKWTSARTNTVSRLSPTARRKSRTSVRPASTFSASIVSERKPGASSATAYVPAGIAAMCSALRNRCGPTRRNRSSRRAANRGALNKSSRRIEHTSLENRQALRVGRARGAEQHQHDERKAASCDLDSPLSLLTVRFRRHVAGRRLIPPLFAVPDVQYARLS